MILRRTEDGVVCYARTGRTVTSHWMDLAVPARVLPPGTVLDGDAVIWHDRRMDFGAVQARASSSLDRARALADRLPASYMAFDVLAHPDHGGDALAARPYTERRTVLVVVLADVDPPLQSVLATVDQDTTLQWYETLQPQGVEDIVAKPSGSAYPFGGRTVWCVDCTIWWTVLKRSTWGDRHFTARVALAESPRDPEEARRARADE
ncbi:hypothetical protein ACFWRV_20255 [Streptomyces sp. NPDC058576]|uniref:ATP-dependent DNA ligase n=1 Tax=Streptomyces sp. NPDC058576 TaxID=3346547 RepID=UPI0036688910